MTSTLKRKIDTLEHPASVPPEKRQRVLEFLDVHPGTPDGPNEQVLRMFMHSVLIAIAESYSAPDLANGHFTSDFCQKHDSLNGLLLNVFMAREERDAHFGILWSRVIHILEEEKRLPVPFSTQREMETSNLEIMNRDEMKKQITQAWTIPYQTNAAKTFVRNINKVYSDVLHRNSNLSNDYGNSVAIVQTPGAGKSRMTDEASADVFCLPFCLRNPEHTKLLAWPLPDPDVRRFLMTIEIVKSKATYESLRASYTGFLTTLFKISLQRLQKVLGEEADLIPYTELSRQWRNWLNDNDQVNRSSLYSEVVAECENAVYVAGDEVKLKQRLHLAFRELVDYIRTRTTDIPILSCMIIFDESHELDVIDPNDSALKYRAPNSRYDVLLDVINDLKTQPIVAVFLSTASSINTLAPAIRNARFAPVTATGLRLPAPITETPFDCSPNFPIKAAEVTIATVAKAPFMANFGRPMFWTMLQGIDPNNRDMINSILRLLQARLVGEAEVKKSMQDCASTAKLALVDLRLCLDYDPLHQDTRPLMQHMVSSHMRYVYSVPVHRNYVRTGYPSEPLLAEAAACHLYKFRKASKPQINPFLHILYDQMNQGLSMLEFGERGEVVARVLLTEAYDRAVDLESPHENFSVGCSVQAFLTQLLNDPHIDSVLDSKPDNTEGSALKDAFRNSMLRFTHFVRLDDDLSPTSATAAAALIRGMALILPAGAAYADIILPMVVDREKPLTEENVTGILIQVKRQKRAGASTACDFTAEDMSFFASGYTHRRPYISLIMELGVQPRFKKSDVAESAPIPSSPSQVYKPQREIPRKHDPPTVHPRYNITVYGCSSSVYRVISQGENNMYSTLLATRNHLHEHPRQDESSLEGLKRIKARWMQSEECFDWLDTGLQVAEVTESLSRSEHQEGVSISVFTDD